MDRGDQGGLPEELSSALGRRMCWGEGRVPGRSWPAGRRDGTGTRAPSFRAGLGAGRAGKGFQQLCAGSGSRNGSLRPGQDLNPHRAGSQVCCLIRNHRQPGWKPSHGHANESRNDTSLRQDGQHQRGGQPRARAGACRNRRGCALLVGKGTAACKNTVDA